MLTFPNNRIYEGMKDLCTRFCYEELLAALSGDKPPKEIQGHDTSQGDEYYDQEEMEEEE